MGSHCRSPQAQAQRSEGDQACQLKAGLGPSRCWHALELTEGAVPGLLGRRRVTGGAADRESWWLQAGAASLLPGVPQPALLQPILQTRPSVPGEDHLHCDFTAGAHPGPAGSGRGRTTSEEWKPSRSGRGTDGQCLFRQEGCVGPNAMHSLPLHTLKSQSSSRNLGWMFPRVRVYRSRGLTGTGARPPFSDAEGRTPRSSFYRRRTSRRQRQGEVAAGGNILQLNTSTSGL